MIEKVLRHYLLLKTKARYEAQARPKLVPNPEITI